MNSPPRLWFGCRALILIITVFSAGFSYADANAAVIYDYHPNVFSGFQLGTNAGANQWSTASFLVLPNAYTGVSRFCFDITFTQASAQSGTTHFTLYPEYYYTPTQTFYWFHPLNYATQLVYGEWRAMLDGATTSFDAYWTPSVRNSTAKSDAVCFEVEQDLGRKLTLFQGYVSRFRIVMDAADKNDCRRDIGNDGRCYIYYNYTAPYSSQSLGFQFYTEPGTVEYNRDGLMAGTIEGETNSTMYEGSDFLVPVWPGGSEGGGLWNPSSGSSQLGLSGAKEWCESAFTNDFAQGLCSVAGFLFIPSEDAWQSFGNVASVSQSRIPFSYFYDIRDVMVNVGSASVNFPSVSYDLTLNASTSHINLFSLEKVSQYAPVDLFRTFISYGLWVMFMLYVWHTVRRIV